MISYPQQVRHSDTWITNCTSDHVFEFLIKYQHTWLESDIWADAPRDMTKPWANLPASATGADLESLISWKYWGIYRRDS